MNLSSVHRIRAGTVVDVTDPLQPLVDLPGVRDAADRARDALAEVHRHRTNRRGWANTAAEASVRAARASASIDGGSTELPQPGESGDPILAGALRVAQTLDGDALGNMVATWRRAPLQALARLHLLAAADLVEDAEELGRPRTEPGVAERLDGLAQLVTGGTNAPAPVLAAVVHGELSVLKPFGVADGIVARAASRLVCVASGLDTRNLGVPEVHWMRRLQAYRDGVAGFGAGTVEGVGGWVLFCCGSLEAGAREAGSIAEAFAG
ncbi:oxidoreductase [Rhodococcus rhodochrous]|nr:oxidoreductase [Rhodococcus rhodochrous]OWY80337.1 oxidoreductase [Rhodococcus sp. BUPNP1]